jgi:hypothetical protein
MDTIHPMNNDMFNRHSANFDRTFEAAQKTVKRTIGVMILIWLFGIALSATFLGVIIWAIIKLVNKYLS